MQYVTLVNIGADWPDVVMVGTDQECLTAAIALNEQGYNSAVQAVVSIADALEYAKELEG